MQRIGRRIAGAGLALAVLLLLVLAVTWTQRAPLARDLVARELARRGLPARFKVATIGVRTQALTDIVIGDPAHPDLVARRGEVDVAVGLHGVTVEAIRVEGVRLNASLVDGRLRLGSLDRLLPPPARPGAPVSLPAIDVTVSDGRARLLTPYGPLGLAFDGSGRLSDGFSGRVAVAAARLADSGCVAEAPRAVLHVAIEDRAPMLDGPVSAARIACGAVLADLPRLALDLRLSQGFDRWHGGGTLTASRLAAPEAALGGVALQIGYDGSRALTRGGIDGRAGAVRVAGTQGRDVTLDGRFEAGGGRGALDGRLRVAHVVLPAAALARLRSTAAGAAGYPAAAIVRSVARALAAAGEDLAVDSDVALAGGQGGVRAEASRVVARAASGASLQSVGGARILWTSASGIRAAGEASFGGGGVPQGRVALRPATGGGMTGVARIDPMAQGSERLAIDPVRFTVGLDGSLRVTTMATLSGALPNGRVDDLRLAVDARLRNGVLSAGPGCAPLSWRRLQVATLVLDPATVRLCPTGDALVASSAGGVRLGAEAMSVRLAGRLGDAPLRLAAERAAVSGAGALKLAGVAVILGTGGDATRASLASLDGAFAGAGVAGRFAGGRGKLTAVPFLVEGAGGSWRFADGSLAIGATARVSDAVAPVRFRPLDATDVRVTLANGVVRLGTRLVEPRSGAAVATVAVVHDLGRGAGEAAIKVDDLVFNQRLQPEALTPLTLGIVANVAGHLSGDGRVRWSAGGLTSEGSFATKRLDLAAAFGQVSGIAGTIRFNDLINLLTPPHQRATIASINPGIEVANGTVDYQLLPGRQVGIEQGLWPFAGGTLRLRPTVLDFAETAERRMTLDVAGLDGARFIEMMKFDNIAATGVFDGTLPLVFDKDGGRIVGGSLVARAGGGNLSYVGDVSNAQLGTYGKLAFDALKNLRYKSLRIDLDGALDGEIVSRVGVNGVNQAPVGASVKGVTKQLTGLPFKFNITVKAPFRGLMNSARAFADPSQLIGQQGAVAAPPAVQPK